ncbi:nitrile hydratase accessory protein [Robbsia sp. KACC 23696]|uniref:nitrile hydratase accessory protein n=1 Tax=Robbsia sp. KACC 23696 TaxID=3149231 RepID=UPI00325B434E
MKNTEQSKHALRDLLASDDHADAVFAEPWQAQVFSMAVSLSEAGYFSWPEWVARFACEPEEQGKAYFERWLAALEGIVNERNLVTGTELASRQEAWRRAALATPHGHPIDVEPHLLADGQ